MPLNDLDLNNLDPELKTGSWLDWRVGSWREEHVKGYAGNWIADVPRLLMRRYTCEGDVVVDPMCGVGTSAVEAAYLGRRSVNTDIYPHVLAAGEIATQKALAANGRSKEDAVFHCAGAERFDYESVCPEPASLILFHPPYHDIIQFGDDERDISSCENLNDYLQALCCVAENVRRCLKRKGYMGMLLGDYYRDGEWTPLSYRGMDAVLDSNQLILKGVCAKRTEETQAKQGQRALWRWRNAAHGTIGFQHENLFIFQKK